MCRWRRLAALLALLTPVAQQRPALLDGVPMAHASAAAGHRVTAIPLSGDGTGATNPDAHTTHDARDSHAPSAPRALWCCELATIPVVVTPWLASRMVEAPLVASAVAPIEPRPPHASRSSQLRLPYATAPPAVMA